MAYQVLLEKFETTVFKIVIPILTMRICIRKMPAHVKIGGTYRTQNTEQLSDRDGANKKRIYENAYTCSLLSFNGFSLCLVAEYKM